MLSREQVRVLTGWTEVRLARAVAEKKIYEHPEDGFHPADVYRLSPKGREALEQLRHLHTTGEWWNKYYRWGYLEEAGLIGIERPKHPATGLEYGIEEWRVTLTPLGIEVVEALEDAIEYHGLLEEVKRR